MTAIAPINAAQKHANAKAIVAALEEGLAEARDSFYCGIKASLERQNEKARFKRTQKSIEYLAKESADSIIAKYIARAGGKLWDLLSDRDDFGFSIHLTPSRGFIEGLIKVDFENGDRLCLDSSVRYQWRNSKDVTQYPTRVSYLKAGELDTRQITLEDAALALDRSAPGDIKAKIMAGREARAEAEAMRVNANAKWDDVVAAAEDRLKAAKKAFDKLDHSDWTNNLKAAIKRKDQLAAAEKWEDLNANGYFSFGWEIGHFSEQGTFEDFKASALQDHRNAITEANSRLQTMADENDLLDHKALIHAAKIARKERTEASRALKEAKAERQKARARKAS